MKKLSLKYFDILISTIVAVIVFQLKYGLNKLAPSNINWLLKAKHDWGQHYLGWAFFKDEPWSFPLGKVDSYYYPISTNVGFTDSIPLFAIPFKLFSKLLSTDFQYFGIWFFSCFLLLAYFSIKILKKYNFSKLQIIIITLLITCNPVILYRGMHPALCSHWLIVASIYLYMKKADTKNSMKLNYYQLILLIISALVHPYMTFMIFGFIIILPIKHFFYDKIIKLRQLFFLPIISVFSLLFIWYIVGYIGFSGNLENEVSNAFGLYSMNLNAFYNSFGFSSIIPNQELNNPFQYEGFMYLGFGLILFIAFVLIILIKKIRIKSFTNYTNLIPLLIYCFILLFFSITNKVTFNKTLLFEYDIPLLIEKVGNIFRASSRTFWINYYLIIIASFILFSKLKLNKLVKTIILLFIIGIQYFDLVNFFNKPFINQGAYEIPLNEKRWSSLLSKFKHLNTFPLYDFEGLKTAYEYQELAYLALKNKLTYTNAYVARKNSKDQTMYTDSVINKLLSEPLNTEDIYITNKDNLSSFSVPIFKYNANLSYIDGYYLIYSNKIQPIKQTLEENEILGISKSKLQINNFKVFNRDIESDNRIKLNIEGFNYNTKFININGWAFIENTKNNTNDSIFITLRGNDKTYISKLKLLERKDVTSAFNAENLDNSGIKSINFIDSLDKGIYTIGIAIKEGNNKWSFQDLDKTLKIGYHEFYTPKIKELTTSKENVKLNIELFKEENGIVTSTGWAFLENLNSKTSEISILLSNSKTSYILETEKIKRTDVTDFFKTKYNYSFSGFKTKFKTSNIPKGKYKIGVYILNTSLNKEGFILTEKTIIIP